MSIVRPENAFDYTAGLGNTELQATTVRAGDHLRIERGPFAPTIVVTGLPPCTAQVVRTITHVEIHITPDEPVEHVAPAVE